MKTIDIEKLFRDYAIPTAPHGNSHKAAGWTNTHCPFCEGKKDYHLGYSHSGGYFTCYRCGWKPTVFTFANLLNLSEAETRGLLKLYFARETLPDQKFDAISQRPLSLYTPLLDRSISKLSESFLKKRGFDSDEIVAKWGVKTIAHNAPMGWKHRLFIPIEFKTSIVSYQARACVEDVLPKYRTCNRDKELIFHKHILYGADKATGNSVVVVEGVTDVWRLGFGAVATFGTNVTSQQRIMLRRWKKIFILFDTDEHGAGQRAGLKLANALSGYRDLEVHLIQLEHGDPGELFPEQAKKLMKDLAI